MAWEQGNEGAKNRDREEGDKGMGWQVKNEGWGGRRVTTECV